MKRLIITVITLLLLLTTSSSIIAQDSNDVSEEEYVIIYDEGHGQYFTSDLMQTALTSLNTSFDRDSLVDVTVKLVVHQTGFNSTNLQGADLVIVTNPGFDEDGNLIEVEDTGPEENALANLIEINAGVLFMSNPLSNNQNISGHAKALNDLIFRQKFRSRPLITTETGNPDDLDNTTVILDDTNNAGNSTHIYIPTNNIIPDTLVLEPNNMTSRTEPRILYYGAHITEDLRGQVSGNTSEQAYFVDQTYAVREYEGTPIWMHGQDFGETKGRSIVIGSTIMFSDYPYDQESKWIEKEQNLAFFQNIVGWLLDITPYPEQAPVVTQDFSYFIQTNIIAATVLSAGILLGTFGVFVYRGRLSFSQLFNISTEDKRSEKKRTSKKSDRKPSKTHKKRRKRT